MRRAASLVLLLWIALAPSAYGVARYHGHGPHWRAEDWFAERCGSAGVVLPYALGSLLLAAPVAWGLAVKRERAGK
jgi:hypothetical protein